MVMEAKFCCIKLNFVLIFIPIPLTAELSMKFIIIQFKLNLNFIHVCQIEIGRFINFLYIRV